MNKPINQLDLIPAEPCPRIKPHPAVDLSPTDDDDTQDFDWALDRADVCIEEQPRTAVYLNTTGAIVIRQEGSFGDDDPCIRIRPENISGLIERLKRCVR